MTTKQVARVSGMYPQPRSRLGARAVEADSAESTRERRMPENNVGGVRVKAPGETPSLLAPRARTTAEPRGSRPWRARGRGTSPLRAVLPGTADSSRLRQPQPVVEVGGQSPTHQPALGMRQRHPSDEDFDGVDVTARALRVACRIAWLGSREGPATSAQPRPRGLPLPHGRVGCQNVGHLIDQRFRAVRRCGPAYGPWGAKTRSRC